MPVFVNRMLNLKRIKVIGFDMDYTLVGYNTEELEKTTHRLSIETLIRDFGYPKKIQVLTFDFLRSIVGLVIDKNKGNLIQLSRYGKVKTAYHGLTEIDYKEQNRIYQEMAIDIKTSDFLSLDTSFSISFGVLYAQLIQLKDDGLKLPEYHQIADDIKASLDTVHQDDSLKSIIRRDFKKYISVDPDVARLLERYLDYGKKLMIITNSDYTYTNDLLNFALNPYLQKHDKWQDVFDIVITLAQKPGFFQYSSKFLLVDEKTGLMKNHFGPVSKGIFQGGWFKKLQHDLGVQGSEILYLGDHIFGDVVSIKKSCNWRTALVLGDLKKEMENIEASKDVQHQITTLMNRKSKLEAKINHYDITRHEKKIKRETITKLFDEIDELNSQISIQLTELKKYFNPYWGEVLRAGSEESRFAEQVERFACIYMTQVSDLYSYSPKTYFRPEKRLMPHEIKALGAQCS